MAQQARAAQTRQQIILGAAELFSRVGYDRARLNDIVGETGLTRGAIYFHFQSKDDLATIVIEEFQTKSIDAIAAIAQTGECGMCQIAMLNREMGRLLTVDPVVRAGIRLVVERNAGQAPIPAYLAWIEALKYLVSLGIEQGDVRRGVSPDDGAVFITEAFVGAQILSHAVSGLGDLPARIDRLTGFLLNGLMPDDRLAARPEIGDARLAAAT